MNIKKDLAQAQKLSEARLVTAQQTLKDDLIKVIRMNNLQEYLLQVC
jgi:hypothetical protein